MCKKNVRLWIFLSMTIICGFYLKAEPNRAILSLESGGQSVFPTGTQTNERYRFIDDASRLSYNNDESRYYVYANGDPIAMTKGRATTYISSDIRGSVRTMTDSYGSLQSYYSYSPFGTPYSVKSSSADSTTYPLGFVGKQYNPTTRLYDFGYRDYSPEMGRFTTPDPIRYGENWYCYAHDDPVNFIDYLGLMDIIDTGIVQLKTGAIRGTESGIKDRTEIVVNRSELDNGNNGQFYTSTMQVIIDSSVLSTVPVQSTADHDKKNQDKDHMGDTIPLGTYKGEFLNRSGSYLDAISITGNGVYRDDAVLIHPNAFTGKGSTTPYRTDEKPQGLGCQISKIDDFNTTMDMLHSIGFEGGTPSAEKPNAAWVGKDTIRITIQQKEK